MFAVEYIESLRFERVNDDGTNMVSLILRNCARVNW